MVLPYHKGLIIKKHFYLFLGLFALSYIFLSDLYHFGLELQQVVSEHFLGHKSGEFFSFLQGFKGGEFADQICTFWFKI